MTIVVDGWRVRVPAYVGMDRLRAQQAVVHTHDTTNQVWLEGRGADPVTLGQFFAVWGVRFDGRCLGAACGEVAVTANGTRVDDPVGLLLAGVTAVRSTPDRDARNPTVSRESEPGPPAGQRMAG